MRVLLANGSTHPDGFTAHQLRIVEAALAGRGLSTQWWQLADAPVRGCNDCTACKGSHVCAHGAHDGVNELIDGLNSCDAVVLGSPVYFAGPNGAFCSVLDRAFYATCNWESTLAGMVGASVVNLWRAGASAALDRLNKYFYASQMVVASNEYWNLVHNGEFFGRQDTYGEAMMRHLGNHVADLLCGGRPS